MGIKVCKNKTIPLAIHWLECIDIWYEASLGQRESTLPKKVPGVINGSPQGDLVLYR